MRISGCSYRFAALRKETFFCNFHCSCSTLLSPLSLFFICSWFFSCFWGFHCFSKVMKKLHSFSYWSNKLLVCLFFIFWKYRVLLCSNDRSWGCLRMMLKSYLTRVFFIFCCAWFHWGQLAFQWIGYWKEGMLWGLCTFRFWLWKSHDLFLSFPWWRLNPSRYRLNKTLNGLSCQWQQ